MSNMESEKLKKSFALLTTILFVVLFSFISVRMVETNLLQSNLNTLKYLHLQAKIYMDEVSGYIESHTDAEILEFENLWNNDSYSLTIVQDDTNSSIYYISIKTIDDTHIRLSQKIIK